MHLTTSFLCNAAQHLTTTGTFGARVTVHLRCLHRKHLRSSVLPRAPWRTSPQRMEHVSVCLTGIMLTCKFCAHPLVWGFALTVVAPGLTSCTPAAGSFAGRRAMQPPGGASSISIGDASSYGASPYAAAGRGYSAGVGGGWGGAQDNSSGAGGYGGAYSAGGYGVGGATRECWGSKHAC